jgi:hypothetical protein
LGTVRVPGLAPLAVEAYEIKRCFCRIYERPNKRRHLSKNASRRKCGMLRFLVGIAGWFYFLRIILIVLVLSLPAQLPWLCEPVYAAFELSQVKHNHLMI